MSCILAIDPAWTERNPSGVCVLYEQDGLWRCGGVAPSYGQFIQLGENQLVNWAENPPAGTPPVPELITAATTIAGVPPTLVVIDMPVATVPIVGRRPADTAISEVFGAKGCSAHSPNQMRPGNIGVNLFAQCQEAGYPLATMGQPNVNVRSLIETYPHPAILTLMNLGYRLPYKVSRRNRYWPALDNNQRKNELLQQWENMLGVLSEQIADIAVPLPQNNATFASMKRYEDAIDALVCGWVGMRYLQNHNIAAYGDETSAIWIPYAQQH